jgi:hypothetical protein
MDSGTRPELDPDGDCQTLCIDEFVSTPEPGDASVGPPVRSRP